MRLFARLTPLALALCGCAPSPDVAPEDAGERPDAAMQDAPKDVVAPPDTRAPRDDGEATDAASDVASDVASDAARDVVRDAVDARSGSDVEPDPPAPPRRFWWDNERIDPDLAPDPVWGDGHVHSDFSGDGNHPALAMMNRAKELGADFVWITDHAQTPANMGGVSAAEFDVCSARGRDATDADQFAGCGVEYRLGYTRSNGTRVYEAWHQIVHNIDSDEFGEVLNVQGYTSWPAYQRDLARTQAYAVLTHPSGPTPWFDDDDSAFRDTEPSNHPNTELIELNGGDDNPDNGNNQVDGLNTYFRFLNERWQVSPVWDSDMHQFYAGAERAKGYGAWIDRRQWRPESFRSVLRGSARRHSSFANHPGNERNWIRVISLVSGAPEAMMGSTLAPRETLRLRVRANIDRGHERWTFKLFTNRDARFGSPARVAGAAATDVVNDGGVQQWEPALDTAGVLWVVAYASTDDGAPGPETQYVVSAPIWLNNR